MLMWAPLTHQKPESVQSWQEPLRLWPLGGTHGCPFPVHAHAAGSRKPANSSGSSLGWLVFSWDPETPALPVDPLHTHPLLPPVMVVTVSHRLVLNRAGPGVRVSCTKGTFSVSNIPFLMTVCGRQGCGPSGKRSVLGAISGLRRSREDAVRKMRCSVYA